MVISHEAGSWQMTELLVAVCFTGEGKSPNPKAEELCADDDKTYKGQEGRGNGRGEELESPILEVQGSSESAEASLFCPVSRKDLVKRLLIRTKALLISEIFL